jgi:hypothetical protein
MDVSQLHLPLQRITTGVPRGDRGSATQATDSAQSPLGLPNSIDTTPGGQPLVFMTGALASSSCPRPRHFFPYREQRRLPRLARAG